MQVTGNNFLAGAGLAQNQNTGVGVGHLLHHLPHMLDRTTGTDEAAEQVRFAMTTTLTGLIVHFTIDLGTVQGIQQFAVAGRHFQRRQHAPAHVFRKLDGRTFAQKQNRKELIPCGDGLKQSLKAARGVYVADQHAKHFPRRP